MPDDSVNPADVQLIRDFIAAKELQRKATDNTDLAMREMQLRLSFPDGMARKLDVDGYRVMITRYGPDVVSVTYSKIPEPAAKT